MDNLRLAHKNARKDKLFYREVKMVDSNEVLLPGTDSKNVNEQEL